MGFDPLSSTRKKHVMTIFLFFFFWNIVREKKKNTRFAIDDQLIT